MFRTGWKLTCLAFTLAAATFVVILATRSDEDTIVGQLAGFGVIAFCVSVWFGARQLAGFASVPVLGSELIEVSASDESIWIQTLIVGCLWYVTVEVGWEAIERRDASQHSRAAVLQRSREVITVVALSLIGGVMALVTVSVAPVRTLPVQALVIIGVLSLFVMSLRHVSASST